MTQGREGELAGLIERTAAAASAFIRGDLRTYAALVRHSADFTLMSPYGGEIRRGFDGSDEAVERTARVFQGGEAELEVVQASMSEELAVLAVIERQRGVVGDLPEQDYSLRVTLVFRREEGEWRLIHRHADALVHPIDHERVAALARGEG